jgi:urease accessory protein
MMNEIVGVTTANTASAADWEAKLSLTYGRRSQRTILERRAHRGPLVVQKSLYPEGGYVCQNIVVHPPAGVAGGDRLALEAAVGEEAWAQLTTPGAARWYRSSGAPARQTLDFSVADGGVLEWLPQETIIFNGAIAELETRIALAREAIFIGWDIVCLGRRFAGERFLQGRFAQDVVARRDGARQWMEQTRLESGCALLESGVGLAGHSVFGTFLALAPLVPDTVIAACRRVACDAGEVAVTHLPGILLARYRGDSAEAARDYFAALWSRARPTICGRDAVSPRIWNT